MIVMSFLVSLTLANVLQPNLTEVRENLNRGGRIIDGDRAYPGQFPYYVLLRLFFNDLDYALCGGSLIKPNWVLTVTSWFSRNRFKFNKFFLHVLGCTLRARYSSASDCLLSLRFDGQTFLVFTLRKNYRPWRLCSEKFFERHCPY